MSENQDNPETPPTDVETEGAGNTAAPPEAKAGQTADAPDATSAAAASAPTDDAPGAGTPDAATVPAPPAELTIPEAVEPPEIVAILPVRNTVVFPHAVMP